MHDAHVHKELRQDCPKVSCRIDGIRGDSYRQKLTLGVRGPELALGQVIAHMLSAIPTGGRLSLTCQQGHGTQEASVKAAAQDQWKLLDLAQTDRRIAQAEHRRRTLPELAELKDLAVQRRTLAEEVVAKSTALSDAKMEQERIEGDLEPARARMERNQKTVDAGTITDHKALRGLTEEIEHLGRRISRLEDAELEAMQAVEDAERAHADADRRRIELDGHIRTVLVSRDAGLKEIDEGLSELRRVRQTQAGGVPADLLKLYELLRERTGMGCAKLVHGVCEGCGIAATAADLRSYAAAGDDEVVRCEECDRILVRTGESI